MAALFFSMLCLLLLTHSKLKSATAIQSSVISHCPTTCGNVKLVYPFGTGEGCYYQGFEIICDQGIPRLAESNLELLEIVESSQPYVSVNSRDFITTTCTTTNRDMALNQTTIQLPEGSPYNISVASNKLITIGCETEGMVSSNSGPENHCHSHCESLSSVETGACNNGGCCQTLLPQASKILHVTIAQDSRSPSPCSHGFIADESYIFSKSHVHDLPVTETIKMRLEWSFPVYLGNRSRSVNPVDSSTNCSAVAGELDYACGENSRCVQSRDRYNCRCKDGYEGNPHLSGPQGCQEIDSCKDSGGRMAGSRCNNKLTASQLARGLTLCIGLILLFAFALHLARTRSELVKLRGEYFRKNGGLLLQQQLSSPHEYSNIPRIYSDQELRKATNNYSVNTILGSGGNGTVYRGILKDGSTVAIKKSQIADQIHIDQFINELFILTQINHRNVVKLLGCCLETQVPMLVYEFIPNGNLYQKIHEKPGELIWKIRLRIAIEVAEALSYLHSSASMPIFHRDIKSSNILLDENYTAKVADFGISRLVAVDETKVSTAVLGTFGYLDPEYFQSGKLTAKSDVYSFGVVLLELLTGRKSLCADSSMEYCNLPMVFLSYVDDDNLVEILDKELVREVETEEMQAVVDIATRCLRVKGKERPTMKEILQELLVLQAYNEAYENQRPQEFEQREMV